MPDNVYLQENAPFVLQHEQGTGQGLDLAKANFFHFFCFSPTFQFPDFHFALFVHS